MKDFHKLLIAVVGCELVGFFSAMFTLQSIPVWYNYLHKPSFNPPNWVFGPVWTILYVLMGISLYLVWREGTKKKKVADAMKMFLVQLLCNYLWSFAFFGMTSILAGFVDIILLLITLIITMVLFFRVSKTAFYLLIPYLLWVGFATILNAALIPLN